MDLASDPRGQRPVLSHGIPAQCFLESGEGLSRMPSRRVRFAEGAGGFTWLVWGSNGEDRVRAERAEGNAKQVHDGRRSRQEA